MYLYDHFNVHLAALQFTAKTYSAPSPLMVIASFDAQCALVSLIWKWFWYLNSMSFAVFTKTVFLSKSCSLKVYMLNLTPSVWSFAFSLWTWHGLTALGTLLTTYCNASFATFHMSLQSEHMETVLRRKTVLLIIALRPAGMVTVAAVWRGVSWLELEHRIWTLDPCHTLQGISIAIIPHDRGLPQ